MSVEFDGFDDRRVSMSGLVDLIDLAPRRISTGRPLNRLKTLFEFFCAICPSK
jgi:hypothetical protein